MLKIDISNQDSDGGVSCSIEQSGSMKDLAAELGLAVSKIHAGFKQSDPCAAALFRAMISCMFSDPDYWAIETRAESATMVSCVIPRKEED